MSYARRLAHLTRAYITRPGTQRNQPDSVAEAEKKPQTSYDEAHGGRAAPPSSLEHDAAWMPGVRSTQCSAGGVSGVCPNCSRVHAWLIWRGCVCAPCRPLPGVCGAVAGSDAPFGRTARRCYAVPKHSHCVVLCGPYHSRVSSLSLCVAATPTLPMSLHPPCRPAPSD
jgi:hypothetical protein